MLRPLFSSIIKDIYVGLQYTKDMFFLLNYVHFVNFNMTKAKQIVGLKTGACQLPASVIVTKLY